MNEETRTLLALLGHVFLRNARPDKAAVILAALDRISPRQQETLRAWALALVRDNKPRQALDVLDRLAIAGGVDTAFHLLRAQALASLGRHDEATSAMNNYLQLRNFATIDSVTRKQDT